MRPLTVINGFILGSCLAIAVSLGMVLIVFLVLGDDHPRLSGEFGPLSESLAIFTAMTIVSAVSFYAMSKQHPARFIAFGVVLLGLVLTGLYYWP